MINKKVKIINSPLIEHYFSIVRNKNSNLKDFRFAFLKINELIVNEISKDFQTENIEIETPLEKTICKKIKNKIILLPILRAGLIMLDGFKNMIPFSLIGHIGFFRDKKNYKIHKYYFQIPKHEKNDQIIILDTMIATGNTILKAIEEIKKETNAKITIVSINSCNEGIENILKSFSDIQIYTVKIDPKLNNKKYIVPGIGDAGDRFFGTE